MFAWPRRHRRHQVSLFIRKVLDWPIGRLVGREESEEGKRVWEVKCIFLRVVLFFVY